MTSFSASRVSSSTSARGTDAIAIALGGDGVSVTTTSEAQVSGERLLVATGRYADTDERGFSGTPDTSPAGKTRGVAGALMGVADELDVGGYTALGPRSGSPVQDFGRCSAWSTKPVQGHRRSAARPRAGRC